MFGVHVAREDKVHNKKKLSERDETNLISKNVPMLASS